MTDRILVAEQVVAVATVETPRGSAAAVAVEQTATATVVAEQGPAGPPGRDGGGAIQIPAGAVLNGHRVVRASPAGLAVHASCVTPADAIAVIGITDGAADVGAPVTIVASGEMVEPSWSWLPGQPVWLGANGALIQPQPNNGDLMQIAVALSPTRIIVALGTPILRTTQGI